MKLLGHKCSAVAEIGDRLATIDAAENWGAMPLFGGELPSWVPMKRNVAWAEAYLRTKWHLDPYIRLATTNMGRKLGAVPPFWGGKLGPHLVQCGMGRGLPPYQVAS